MAKYSPEAIARFEDVLRNDPNSQVFAPLADVYCSEGRIAEAEKLAERGIRIHPQFAGGWVVWGKVLKAQKKFAEAVDALHRALSLSPENLLAAQILGETLLEQKKPKEALKVFKKILFLNPLAEKAKRIVEKLESLTADEYEDDLFALQKLEPLAGKAPAAPAPQPASAEKAPRAPIGGVGRMISLIDAFIARNDIDEARRLLDEALVEFGENDEIFQRQSLIQKRHKSRLAHADEVAEPLAPMGSREESIRQKKIATLQGILTAIQRIKEAPSEAL